MRLFTKRYHPPGTDPGTLHRQQKLDAQPHHLQLLDYNAQSFHELLNPPLDHIQNQLDSKSCTWLKIHGQPDATWLEKLGSLIDLHPLAQEDILNGGQRSKVESYENQLFIVIDVPDMRDEKVTIEQLYILWHQHYVLTFFNGNQDTFEPLVKKLQTSGTRLRKHDLDYLMYSILDLAIDKAFPVLEHLGIQLETLEEQLMQNPDESVLHTIHGIKRQIILLRRALWPQREVLNLLMRDEDHWFSKPVRLYLRDCYDHSIQIMDLVESYRDTGSSLHDLYLSSASMKMNDIMRVLAVISTVFIPLTFIAGVYGMNFSSESDSAWAMPELHWAFGYPMVWILFLSIALAMVVWFKRKHWL